MSRNNREVIIKDWNDCKNCRDTKSVRGGFKFICSVCKRVHYISRYY